MDLKLRALKEQNDQLRIEIEASRTKANQDTAKIRQLREERDEAQGKLADLKPTLKQLQKEKTAAERTTRDVTKAKLKIQEKYKASETKYSKLLKKAAEGLRKERKEKDQLKKEKQALQKKVKGLEGELKPRQQRQPPPRSQRQPSDISSQSSTNQKPRDPLISTTPLPPPSPKAFNGISFPLHEKKRFEASLRHLREDKEQLELRVKRLDSEVLRLESENRKSARIIETLKTKVARCQQASQSIATSERVLGSGNDLVSITRILNRFRSRWKAKRQTSLSSHSLSSSASSSPPQFAKFLEFELGGLPPFVSHIILSGKPSFHLLMELESQLFSRVMEAVVKIDEHYRREKKPTSLSSSSFSQTMNRMARLIFRLSRARSAPTHDDDSGSSSSSSSTDSKNGLVLFIIRNLIENLNGVSSPYSSSSWKRKQACSLLAGYLAKGFELKPAALSRRFSTLGITIARAVANHIILAHPKVKHQLELLHRLSEGIPGALTGSPKICPLCDAIRVSITKAVFDEGSEEEESLLRALAAKNRWPDEDTTSFKLLKERAEVTEYLLACKPKNPTGSANSIDMSTFDHVLAALQIISLGYSPSDLVSEVLKPIHNRLIISQSKNQEEVSFFIRALGVTTKCLTPARGILHDAVEEIVAGIQSSLLACFRSKSCGSEIKAAAAASLVELSHDRTSAEVELLRQGGSHRVLSHDIASTEVKLSIEHGKETRPAGAGIKRKRNGRGRGSGRSRGRGRGCGRVKNPGGSRGRGRGRVKNVNGGGDTLIAKLKRARIVVKTRNVREMAGYG